MLTSPALNTVLKDTHVLCTEGWVGNSLGGGVIFSLMCTLDCNDSFKPWFYLIGNFNFTVIFNYHDFISTKLIVVQCKILQDTQAFDICVVNGSQLLPCQSSVTVYPLSAC